jgi:hypothetical protein
VALGRVELQVEAELCRLAVAGPVRRARDPGPARPATAGPPGGARPVGQARGVVTTATPPSGQSVWAQRTLAAHLAGRFATCEDLEAQIIDFTLAHNETAEPYQWRYDAEAEHARYLDRHPTRPPDPSTEVLPRAA